MNLEWFRGERIKDIIKYIKILLNWCRQGTSTPVGELPMPPDLVINAGI